MRVERKNAREMAGLACGEKEESELVRGRGCGEAMDKTVEKHDVLFCGSSVRARFCDPAVTPDASVRHCSSMIAGCRSWRARGLGFSCRESAGGRQHKKRRAA
jgi:hypothetical protein